MWKDNFDPSDPEMLAAYADGEFEGNPSLAWEKQAIEKWLEAHPDAAEDIADWRRLKQLWQATSPPEPSPETWSRIAAGIQEQVQRAEVEAVRSSPWGWIGGAAAALFLALLLGWHWLQGPPADIPAPVVDNKSKPAPVVVEVLPVAAAEEVEILRVAGEDTPALVVGSLPIDGPLVLAGRHEVQIEVQPATDGTMPQVNEHSQYPMIWAGGGLEP